MPHIIAIEHSDSQRRQLKEELDRLSKSGWPLSGKYDAETFGTWQKLFETAITPGLFAQREAIVIENAEILDAFPDELTALIEDDKADIVIILVFGTKTVRGKDYTGDDDSPDNDGKKTRSVSPVKKYLAPISKSITIIKPEAYILPWKRKEWLIPLVKEQGFTISQDAANLLAENIESQEELRSEIMKLGRYAKGREISRNDVEELSFDEGGLALIMFLDGVCFCNPANVARAIKHLQNDSILPTLTAITNRLRIALITAIFHGKYKDQALKAAGVDLVAKKYAIEKAESALKNYGAERIKTFMAKSARLSFLEKTSRAEGWQGFEAIIWELMTKV